MDFKIEANQKFNFLKKNEFDYCENMITKHFNQNLSSNEIIDLNNINLIQSNNKNNKKFDSNQDQKIKKLIIDCELINNNNINNFVLNYCDQSNSNLNSNTHLNNNNLISIDHFSSNECKCKCHYSQKKKTLNNLIKSNKFLKTLYKLKLTQKLNENKINNNLNNNINTYEILSSSLSNCSLSSSISSHTFNSSTCSNAQENTYNSYNSSHSNPVILVKPVRKPPSPPKQISFRAQAKLPQEVTDYFYKDVTKLLDNKRIYNDVYILNKSVENFVHLNENNNSNKENNKHKPIIEEDLYSDNCFDDESIYAKIDNIESDYDSIKEDEINNKNFIDNKLIKLNIVENEYYNDEDLYQDICLKDFSEDIYESLPKESNNLELNNIKIMKSHENIYKNNETVNRLDLKLLRKQKIIDKKWQIKAEKLNRKFNFTGKEIPLNAGIVKEDVKGNHLDLNINKGEVVLIFRINGNPPGKWLAKNERGKLGYVDLNLIDVDPESIKFLMKIPNLLTNGFV